ncbi:DNA ligase [Bradyrhizobium sp. CCGB12]|uniref:ATP-dependent DNA ligase n=1 Tax=Bradyrhizobium sp. CCGB12 TaxID=2949632 RepID=UPI0020B33251|nr:DNA ligase [Bradyrhizobium sp. CCGB12]MCP3388886.1 DNA ligase [Bradyrhizobium sp. CCGB12]
MLVVRENERVRLLSRNGTDWTKRYSWIAEAALKNRQKRFVVDGEAIILGVDGISDFNALHSRKHDHELQLYAFDILAMGGYDLRSLPLHLRKANLQQLLARRPDGISVARFERGEMGPELFLAACRMPGGSSLQAPRSAVSWRPAKALGQGEEPAASRDGKRVMKIGPFELINVQIVQVFLANPARIEKSMQCAPN